MSAKLIYSLSSDDNPKQLGCINGFLQHFLSGRAVNGHVGQHQKRLPSGPIMIKDQAKMESKDTRDQETKEKKPLKKNNKEASSLSPSQHQGESKTRDIVMKEPKSSINSRQLSVRSSRKQQIISNVIKHIDSPRPLQPSNLQNQKPSNSNSNSTPINTTPRASKPHARRLSYDGRETNESIKSSLKLNELPRLSLDSRQGRTKSASVSELKSDFLHAEEPVSSRAVSSVVARLMGLEDLDFSSRTTKSTDESDTDSERHSVSIYKEIDKRLGELDFRKSGKDLRALKHILDAMQRTKSKMEAQESMDNSIKISQYVALEQWNGVKSKNSPSKQTSNLPRVRTRQAAKVDKRRAKDSSPKIQEKCVKLEKFSQERRARSSSMTTPNQEPKNLTKKKAQNPRQRKLVLDDQCCDLVHTPRPSQKLYKTTGPVTEESTTIVKEQPSPVSVLDADFYGEESLSPVKKKAITFQDDDSSEWTEMDTRSIVRSYSMGKPKETPKNLFIGSYQSIEDENDFLTRIIAKDLARRSDSWTDFSSENSWLVLDIERLLFKDLIVELLREENSC